MVDRPIIAPPPSSSGRPITSARRHSRLGLFGDAGRLSVAVHEPLWRSALAQGFDTR